ncbi:MAG: MerR family transcriptional regulator, partial [Chloroflexi bacterium]
MPTQTVRAYQFNLKRLKQQTMPNSEPRQQMPTYNLKAVVQETGLKHDTLRAWERRYGLPQPQRTPGGHRLYSARDIATLKWLVARQQEGLSISRAVDLWNQLQSEGRDPLAEMDTVAAVPGLSAALPAGGSAIDTIRQTWVDACLSFNEARAEQVLTQASALFAPEVVCAQILQKGVARIGELWAAGEASVQQEHLASTLASRRLEAL